MEQKIQEPQVIGFLLQDKQVIVTNPCNIPIDMMEDVIKQHKARKDKKDVTHFCCIAIPITGVKGLKIKGSNINGTAKRTKRRK